MRWFGQAWVLRGACLSSWGFAKAAWSLVASSRQIAIEKRVSKGTRGWRFFSQKGAYNIKNEYFSWWDFPAATPFTFPLSSPSSLFFLPA
jgi:hypothetical protein